MRSHLLGLGLMMASLSYVPGGALAAGPTGELGEIARTATDAKAEIVLQVRRGGGRGFRGGGGGIYIAPGPSCWWSQRYRRTICSY